MLPVPPRPEGELVVAESAPVQYVLLEANSREALQVTVNTYLRQGWRLQGGVAVVATTGLGGGWWYYQAVVGP